MPLPVMHSLFIGFAGICRDLVGQIVRKSLLKSYTCNMELKDKQADSFKTDDPGFGGGIITYLINY